MANSVPSQKRTTTGSLNGALPQLGGTVSQACKNGLVTEPKKAREAKWLADNRAAIDSSNAWFDYHMNRGGPGYALDCSIRFSKLTASFIQW
ncbi:MAG: Post-segregation antitoxin CcdA [Pseudomonadota bacterium]